MAGKRTMQRQPVKQVFAAEFAEITKTYKDPNDQKAPVFALLPTGERCNRVFVVGRIRQCGLAKNQKDYIAKISDPTGNIRVSASQQYAPDAKRALSKIDLTHQVYAGIVGTAKTYRPQNDPSAVVVSLEAKHVYVLDGALYAQWVVHTAHQTVGRIKKFLSDPEDRDVRDARETYKAYGAAHWLEVCSDALQSVR
ncbi:MAG: nucleic acid-binding protein [Methanocorpusculum sp.]|nr:nucleic acid-binding protein [Methanocorpusculum sp.]